MTAGAEIAGVTWDRGGDSLRLALARLVSSDNLIRDSATADDNGDGIADFR